MWNSLLAAVVALTLAAPAAAQTSPPSSANPLNMPVAPPGLGERITMGTQTFESPLAAAYGVATSQLTAAQIRQIQQRLRAQGIALRRIDGRFGPETAGAVQSFEQRQNIASVPGQIDARTLGLLGVGVAPNQPRVAAPGMTGR
jgi:peptidoglycan hydrolase-like protein with peptidoglycan-binding domain